MLLLALHPLVRDEVSLQATRVAGTPEFDGQQTQTSGGNNTAF